MDTDAQQDKILLYCCDEDTATAIENGFDVSDDVTVQRIPNDHRAVDVVVMVALASAGSAAATAVLSGIFGVLTQRGRKTVRIRGASGREIEVPADTPADRLDEYVAIARRLDISSIEIE